MRDLTKEELKLAPDWATHYYVFDNGTIQFESKEFYSRLSAVTCRMGATQCNKDYGIGGVPIPFDITKHELFKSGILTKHKNGKDLYVNHLMWQLDKDRAIAIAKALGVTGDDL